MSDIPEPIALYLERRERALDEVRRLLASIINYEGEPSDIDPDAGALRDRPGLDSLDAVEVLVGLEIDLGIKLEGDDPMRLGLRSVNGVVDAVMRVRGAAMTLASEVRALRSSVALSRASHIAVVAVEGPDALELLQAASTQSPYVREGRVRHALLLREDASVFADVFIVKVEESFLVLAEGPDEPALVAALEGAREHATSKQATVRAMHDEWAILGIDGPYAWEVISRLLGPSALGMPYLTLLRREELLLSPCGQDG